MASSRPRAVQGISFSEAPFIEPASATTHPSPFVDGENGQVAPNTSSDGSPSSRNAQNAASGSNQEPRRQGVTQRSSFNPSASIWVPSASTQARQRDDTRPLVVGYPPGYRIPDALQNRNQVQVQSQAQSQVQHQTPGQAQNQFDMLSFALAHTQAHDENPNVGMP